jgi:LPXTG-motif cell wall-anchored protein
MRRYLALLAAAAIAAVWLAIPAFAASGSFGPMDWDTEFGNAEQQKGWEVADEAAAKAIKIVTITFAADSAIAEGERFDFINNFGGWKEYQHSVTAAEVSARKIVVDLSKVPAYGYADITEGGNLGLAFWGEGGFAGAKVTAIEWTSGAASGNNPQTGVETYIFAALGVLTLAVAGAFAFTRKAKA